MECTVYASAHCLHRRGRFSYRCQSLTNTTPPPHPEKLRFNSNLLAHQKLSLASNGVLQWVLLCIYLTCKTHTAAEYHTGIIQYFIDYPRISFSSGHVIEFVITSLHLTMPISVSPLNSSAFRRAILKTEDGNCQCVQYMVTRSLPAKISLVVEVFVNRVAWHDEMACICQSLLPILFAVCN